MGTGRGTATVIADICRRCQESGDDVAVVDDDVPLSGAELLERARALSSELQDLGVIPGSRVALSMAPCSDLYVSIVAIWLAGAAFVPIDPEEAPGRRARILAVSQASVVLGLPSRNGCPETGSTPWAAISGGRVVSVSDSTHVPGVRSLWADEAYVIFTSGSAGLPKGVSVGHDAIGAYVREACRIFAIPDSGMAFPLHLPPTFDAALTSLLPPLVTRNVAVPVADPVSFDPRARAIPGPHHRACLGQDHT